MSWFGQKEARLISGVTAAYSLILLGSFLVFRKVVFDVSDSVGLRIVVVILIQVLLLYLAWQIFEYFHSPRPTIMIKRLIKLFSTITILVVAGPMAALGLKVVQMENLPENPVIGKLQKVVLVFESVNIPFILAINAIVLLILISSYNRQAQKEELGVSN